jgi:hypothetical protein
MMFDKYDSMKSLTQKNNVESKNFFFCQNCGAQYANGKGSVTPARMEYHSRGNIKTSLESETTVTSKAQTANKINEIDSGNPHGHY